MSTCTLQYGDLRLPVHYWAKTTAGDGCWNWTAAVNSKGYGCFAINGRSQLAHRVAYRALVGPIDHGMTIDHLCRNKLCQNPEHMEQVTPAENIRRAVAHRPATRGPYNRHITPRAAYIAAARQDEEGAA